MSNRVRLTLTDEQVYVLCEVLGRVTARQLSRMGIDKRERAELDELHELLVNVLAPEAPADPRQLSLLEALDTDTDPH